MPLERFICAYWALVSRNLNGDTKSYLGFNGLGAGGIQHCNIWS